MTELVPSPQEKHIGIPEEYRAVTCIELVRAKSLTYVPVLCQVNMTTQNVSQLQSILKSKTTINAM